MTKVHPSLVHLHTRPLYALQSDSQASGQSDFRGMRYASSNLLNLNSYITVPLEPLPLNSSSRFPAEFSTTKRARPSL
ncbi:hypothetical protein AAP_03205 [Ascosphaera apis ARSEF 7405]|uniref:Uncharacterized protein n=1 Tax=Ascosphaera apis ARSEF 7405 TaxID=392613 RepID=A0A167Z0B0_9EURO|nr:hypothetical protein AAP_03205 [Ascosphaera apis ARSEF 7405]